MAGMMKAGRTFADEIAVLEELKATKLQLEEFRAKNGSLTHENGRLKSEQAESEEMNQDVIAYWQQQVAEKETQIQELDERLEVQAEGFEKEKVYADEVFEAKVKVLEDELEHTEARLQAQNAELAAQLDGLREFRATKERVEATVAQLKSDKKELEDRQSETVVKMERKFIEEKSRLQKDINKKLLDYKKQNEEMVNENLDAATKRILLQNRQMAGELRLHVQETDELLKTKARLDEERRRAGREADLQREAAEKLATKGARQRRDISDRGDKIKTLERTLTRVVKEFEKQQNEAEQGTSARAGELERELRNVRMELQARSRELKTLRRLARDILGQRSDVEQFFLEALDTCRKEIATRNKRQAREQQAAYRRQLREATLGRGEFPQIMGDTLPSGVSPFSRVTQASSQDDPEAKVDLSELSLEDKEAVLRMLFSKINASTAQRQQEAVGAQDFGASFGAASFIISGDMNAVAGGHDSVFGGGLSGGRLPGVA